MRDLFIVLLYLLLILMCIACAMVDIRTRNVERQLARVEYDYQTIAAQNEQLRRINDQNLQLIAEGGWK